MDHLVRKFRKEMEESGLEPEERSQFLMWLVSDSLNDVLEKLREVDGSLDYLAKCVEKNTDSNQ